MKWEPAIQNMDAQLRQKQPDYYHKLNSGVTDAQLDELEAYLGFSLPEAYRALYRWKNGQPADVLTSFMENTNWMFIPLDHVRHIHQTMTGMLESGDFELENWWSPKWVPFLGNGAGDYCCVDMAGTFTGQVGQVVWFRHESGNRTIDAPSLPMFFGWDTSQFYADEHFKAGPEKTTGYFLRLVKRNDLDEIEKNRGQFVRHCADKLVQAYWTLDTWIEKNNLVQLLQDMPHDQVYEIMVDFLKAEPSGNLDAGALLETKAMAMCHVCRDFDKFMLYYENPGLIEEHARDYLTDVEPSENFKRFVKSFFGDASAAARDGLDLQALRQLKPGERARAEEMLLEKLGPENGRAVVGLGELRSQRAASPLRELLQSSGELVQSHRGIFLISLAVALWQIERLPESLQNVANVLAQSPHSSVRTEAAMAMRNFSCQETVRILKDALNDENSLVRYHAARSLLAIHGLLSDEYETPPSAIKVMSEKHQEGVAELDRLLSGRSLQACFS